MEKNQRSRMNCVVEKKRAEEVMDHQPKTVRLPFGVNITTDPRYEHITGERMAIYCESGHDQRYKTFRLTNNYITWSYQTNLILRFLDIYPWNPCSNSSNNKLP